MDQETEKGLGSLGDLKQPAQPYKTQNVLEASCFISERHRGNRISPGAGTQSKISAD